MLVKGATATNHVYQGMISAIYVKDDTKINLDTSEMGDVYSHQRIMPSLL